MSIDGAFAITGTADTKPGDATRSPPKPLDKPMHVKLNYSTGEWCKLLPSSPIYRQIDLQGSYTCCEQQVIGYYGTRAEVLNGEPLCQRGCFTPFEMRVNELIRIAEIERRRKEAEEAEREFAERAKQRANDIDIGRHRVEDATGQRRLVDIRDDQIHEDDEEPGNDQ